MDNIELEDIVGENLVFKLDQVIYKGERVIKDIGSMMYWNTFKEPINTEKSEYGWYPDWIQNKLQKLPKLETEFRNVVTEIHNIVKDHPEHIPTNTIYCYNNNVCPYWIKSPFDCSQNNGVCLFNNTFDSSDGMGLVWDQVKCCGIGEDEPCGNY